MDYSITGKNPFEHFFELENKTTFSVTELTELYFTFNPDQPKDTGWPIILEFFNQNNMELQLQQN